MCDGKIQGPGRWRMAGSAVLNVLDESIGCPQDTVRRYPAALFGILPVSLLHRLFFSFNPVDFTCLICCDQIHIAFSVGHELVDPSFESVLWNLECFRHALVVRVCDVRLLLETPDDSTCSLHGSSSNSSHPLSYFINLVAELEEDVHAELVRLATELEAVKGQVQTERNARRDLFARATTAMSSSGPQHDRRLNHRAGRHLPQQFGGSWLDYGDFAFRMEGYAAVLSRDGQSAALLREVAKLDKFEDNTVAILGKSFWDVQQLSAAMAAALCTRGEVATLVRRILSPWRRAPSLARSHAMVQAQISGGTCCVDGETHIAKAHQERE